MPWHSHPVGVARFGRLMGTIGKAGQTP
jgi:hypothetical protein